MNGVSEDWEIGNRNLVIGKLLGPLMCRNGEKLFCFEELGDGWISVLFLGDHFTGFVCK